MKRMKVKVIEKGFHPFGGNRMLTVEMSDGSVIRATRQGGLENFWAYPGRPKLSLEEAKKFDEMMAEAWDDVKQFSFDNGEVIKAKDLIEVIKTLETKRVEISHDENGITIREWGKDFE